MRDTITITITETGCYLDNHRGHYLSRDVIDVATGWGFMIGPFEEYAVRMYDSANEGGSEVEYPHEGIIELCDEAIAWLNSGQDECTFCDGTSKAKNGWIDKDGISRCKPCTGTGRGPRIEGQNFPPRIPEWTEWRFNDGDFGLYYIESNECPVCNADGSHLSADEIMDIENSTGEPWWLHNCSH